MESKNSPILVSQLKLTYLDIMIRVGMILRKDKHKQHKNIIEIMPLYSALHHLFCTLNIYIYL